MIKTHNINYNCSYLNVDLFVIQFLFLIRARFIWRVSTYYKHNFMRLKLTLLHLNLLYSYIQGKVHKSHKLLKIFILSWLGRLLLWIFKGKVQKNDQKYSDDHYGYINQDPRTSSDSFALWILYKCSRAPRSRWSWISIDFLWIC